MSASSMTAPKLDAFVIRNTFLELTDDADALPESRCRSVSDYTNARSRSWSNTSDQCSSGHPLLEAVLEAEYDTDVPDEEELLGGRSQSLTDGRLSLTCSSTMSWPDPSDDAEVSEGSYSNTLNAEMLALLEDENDGSGDASGDDDTCRERARTSSTLFWVAHEATGLLTLVDEDGIPTVDRPRQQQTQTATEPSADTKSDDSCGDSPVLPHVVPQEVCVQSFVPTLVGSYLPPMWPVAMPVYACQPMQSTSTLASPCVPATASAPAPSSIQSMRKPGSSSSLDLSKSESESSGMEQSKERESKSSKKKARRGRHDVWQSSSNTEDAQSEPTTVMLRNIPNRYTRKMFVRMLDLHGFSCEYDFVYLPIDFKHSVNLGYAFVNMASHESAVRLKSTLNGFSAWAFDSQKVCEAVWASPHQGLAPNIERYRDSPVMHASVADEFKPLLFKDGVRVAFPPPTKNIRAPKARETGGGDHA